jgi:hypothetical protein
MVRGTSEGLVTLWIACATLLRDMTIEVALLALLNGAGVISLLETVESGPRCRTGVALCSADHYYSCQLEPECGGGGKL